MIRIITKAQTKAALEKHETRAAVAISLDCSPSTVSRLISKVYPELHALAKWKQNTKKIWRHS